MRYFLKSCIRFEMERREDRSAFVFDSASFSEPVHLLLLDEFELMIRRGRLQAYSGRKNMANQTVDGGAWVVQ
ncbi:MAG TPA: hypothetical protein IAA13_00155 [Candidatus Alistipes merdigallinarum]|nr:hypothetical protein [Candidatus Alistipes merdigallinarum]